MIRMRSIFEIEIRKISPCGSRSPDNAEFGHFTLLFCRGRQRNVPRINNYWMRLSMISWIIKTEVCVICRNRRLRQITQTRGFDDSWYHAKTEFNNCFIIHFSRNSSSETEAKHSALTSGRRHSTLNKRTPLNKPIIFIVFLLQLILRWSFSSCRKKGEQRHWLISKRALHRNTSKKLLWLFGTEGRS